MNMDLKHLRRQPKSHGSHLMPTASASRSLIAKRRSTRLLLSASIGLSGEDRLKCPFTMPARATNLNRHGAAVQLSRDLVVGSVMLLRNKRGTEVSARIVAQLTATQRVSTYGIEFVEQDDRAGNFWGISFPVGDKSRLHSLPGMMSVIDGRSIRFRVAHGQPSSGARVFSLD